VIFHHSVASIPAGVQLIHRDSIILERRYEQLYQDKRCRVLSWCLRSSHRECDAHTQGEPVPYTPFRMKILETPTVVAANTSIEVISQYVGVAVDSVTSS
jgi:hypothetical protein